ncbi:MAG: ROK family protein [Elusimicrobiota bacterium]|jgi:glucokinase|nr:ROK family protein [Elusimicrobiota bacterium]
MTKKHFLGIDIGGTSVKIAIVKSDLEILSQTSLPTNIKEEPRKVLKDILKAAAGLEGYDKVKSIGLGIPGDVDSKNGILRRAYNLPKWKNIFVRNILHKYSKKKVCIDNDANAASLGAFWLDTGGKANNLVCITLGTGIGGGIILNKKIYRGSSSSAGEIGHMTITYDRNVCNCENIGCVEAYIGAKNLTAYSVNYIKKHKSPIIMKFIDNDFSKLTIEILYKSALRKDKTALELWQYAGEILGVLLSNIVNFINPDTIVLCGGVSRAEKFILPLAKKEMKMRAFKTPARICNVICSKWSNKLGVVGAAMLAEQ